MRREIITVVVVVGTALAVFGSVALAAPGVPATFTAAARSSCIVDLAWTAASDSGPRYTVQYTTQPTFYEGGTTLLTTLNAGVVSAEHNNLTPATTYRYRIQSVDGVKTSAYLPSTPASITTPALPAAPAVPVNFGATGVNGTVPADDGKQIDLAWTSPTLSQYGGFSFDRFKEGGTAWEAMGDAPYGARAYRDGGGAVPTLDNTKIYRYRMSAFESAEGCAKVNRSYSSITAEVTVPARPTNLTSAFVYNPNVSANKIDLAWTAGRGHTAYEIQRKTGSGTFVLLTAVTSGVTSYSDTNVVTNEVYAYRVRGCNETGGLKGCSAFTNETSRRVANAPQNLGASIKSISASGATVQLTWENTFAGAGNYLVERAEGSGAFSQLPGATVLAPGGTNPPSSVTYDDTSPALGKNYRYRVRADFLGAFSAYSNEDSANLNVQPVVGWAWSGGLGWVRLSNNSTSSSWGPTTQTPDSQPYTIYMEKDTNLLGGYAWSPVGGWLSFSKNDLGGCPSGTCEARLNMASRTITGWAKFVGLGRWVSLEGTGGGSNYGLYYATTTQSNREVGLLRGFAWGGDVVGWLSLGGPVLKSVTPLATPDLQGNAQVELKWENQASYQNEEIWAGENGSLPKKVGRIDSSQTIRGNFATTTGGLKKNTQYQFFIRGYPEQ